jgi:hypothetical protein
MNTCPNVNSLEYKALLKAVKGDENLAAAIWEASDGAVPANIIKELAVTNFRKKRNKGQRSSANQRMLNVVERIKNVANLIDFDVLKHQYSYKGILLRSTTNKIDSIKEYKYANTTISDYEKNSELGTKMHKVLEDLINGLSKEEIQKGNDFTSDDNFEILYNHLEGIVNRLKGDGTLLTEVRIGNLNNKLAGTIDILVVRPDGSVDIYDLKTSIHPTSEKALYRNHFDGKASKEDKHGLQLATYAKALEMGDTELGIPKLTIGTLSIIPINIKIEGDKVTEVKPEEVIPLSYTRYEAKTNYTLPNQPIYEEQTELDDAEKIFYSTEHKTLEAWAEANYSWYRKDTASEELKKLQLERDEIEFSPNFKGDRAAALNDVQAKIDKITNRRTKLEEGYNQYKLAFRELFEFYSKNKIEEMNDVNELKKILNKYAHLDPQAKNKLDRLQKHLVKKIIDLQVQEIKNKHPEFDFDLSTTKDLKARDKYFKALSDFSEEFPEMQYFAKEYSKVTQEMVQEKQEMLKRYEAVGKKIVKEYNQKNGIVGNVLDFLNPLVSNAKYFEFMDAGNNKAVTKKDAKYQTLTASQKEFVDLVETLYGQYEEQIADSNGNVNLNRLIKVERTFAEDWKEDGLFQAFANYLGSDNYKQRSIKIKQGSDIDTYAAFEQGIKNKIASGKISRVSGLVEIAKLKREANKQIEKGQHADGTKFEFHDRAEFEINAHGELKTKFHHKQSKDARYTKDFYRAYMEMFTEMNFVKHMQPVLPMVEALEVYNQTAGGEGKAREHMLKYIDVFKKGNILREELSGMGRDVDKFVKFFRKLTHLRVMAFNIPAAVFNVFIGKYNQFRGDLLPNHITGEKRFWGNRKKVRSILEKYQAVSIEFDYNPANHIGAFFDMVMFGATRLGEYYIQGAAIAGQMKEEWDWIDENGNILGKDAEEIAKRSETIRKRMDEYKKKVRDIQGKYSDEDKRGFSHFEIGKAAMQFKVWMPDAINDRFSKRYIDINGNVRQGTLHYMATQGFADLKQQLLNPSKDFWTSDKPNDVLLRRNLRAFAAFTSAMALYLMVADDDDDDSKWMAAQLHRAIGDMSFGLSFDGAEATLKNPLPMMSTLVKSIETVESVFLLQSYKDGTLKAPKMILNLAPYNNIIEYPIELSENLLEE